MRYNAAAASHLPALIHMMMLSSGPVLEMGMGPFSTPVLHWLCADQKRLLVSYESNEAHYHQQLPFRSATHEIHLCTSWDKANIERRWGLVFIDHAPAERRRVDIARVARYAGYVVVHDTQPSQDRYYGFLKHKTFELFKYRQDHQNSATHTTVLSNFFLVS